MADETITPVVPVMESEDFTWVTVEDGKNYLFVNPGNCILVVRTSAPEATRKITLYRYATFDGDTVADRDIDITGTEEKVVGIFPTSVYNIKTGVDTGKAKFTFSIHTNVTFLLVRLA